MENIINQLISLSGGSKKNPIDPRLVQFYFDSEAAVGTRGSTVDTNTRARNNPAPRYAAPAAAPAAPRNIIGTITDFPVLKKQEQTREIESTKEARRQEEIRRQEESRRQKEIRRQEEIKRQEEIRRQTTVSADPIQVNKTDGRTVDIENRVAVPGQPAIAGIRPVIPRQEAQTLRVAGQLNTNYFANPFQIPNQILFRDPLLDVLRNQTELVANVLTRAVTDAGLELHRVIGARDWTSSGIRVQITNNRENGDFNILFNLAFGPNVDDVITFTLHPNPPAPRTPALSRDSLHNTNSQMHMHPVIGAPLDSVPQAAVFMTKHEVDGVTRLSIGFYVNERDPEAQYTTPQVIQNFERTSIILTRFFNLLQERTSTSPSRLFGGNLNNVFKNKINNKLFKVEIKNIPEDIKSISAIYNFIIIYLLLGYLLNKATINNENEYINRILNRFKINPIIDENRINIILDYEKIINLDIVQTLYIVTKNVDINIDNINNFIDYNFTIETNKFVEPNKEKINKDLTKPNIYNIPTNRHDVLPTNNVSIYKAKYLKYKNKYLELLNKSK